MTDLEKFSLVIDSIDEFTLDEANEKIDEALSIFQKSQAITTGILTDNKAMLDKIIKEISSKCDAL